MASHPHTDTPAEQATVCTTAADARQWGHDQHHDEHDHEHSHDHAPAFAWPEVARISLVALAAAAVWWRVWEPFAAVSVLGGLGLPICGWALFKEGAPHIPPPATTKGNSM